MTVTAIDARHVTVHYSEVLALHDVSVAVGAGRVCGLIGMNGSGKSTLFKSLMGLVRPDTGQVELRGLAPREARRQGIVGYVPQNEEVDWSFPITVGEVVATGRYAHLGPTRRLRHEDREAVSAALRMVHLEHLDSRQIGELSGGQRKRAFIARAMAQGATVLMLDEPFAGVDKHSEATIVQVLRDAARQGAAVLVATHDLKALPDVADEAILLNQSILLHASIDEVLQPQNLARAFGLNPVQRGA